MPNDPASKAMVAWLPDAAMLDRIIAAVRTSVRKTAFENKWELSLDRDRLASNLQDAHTKWRVVKDQDSEEGARRRAKLFSAIAQKAKDFKESLLDKTGQQYAARAIASNFADAEFDAFLASLDLIIERAEALTQQNKEGWVRLLKRPPKECFAAEILPSVYQDNFGGKAGISQKDPLKSNANTVGGPYIRFAVTTMHEMGIEISAGTVARALKDVRAEGKPRKGGKPRKPRRDPRKTTLKRPPGW